MKQFLCKDLIKHKVVLHDFPEMCNNIQKHELLRMGVVIKVGLCFLKSLFVVVGCIGRFVWGFF